MAPHSSTLAWKIPWTEEPGRLQSMGSLRVGHNWATSLSLFTFTHWRRKWQPTPVFLPGESQGRGSIPGTGEPGRLPSMGSHRVGHDWSDLAAAGFYWKIHSHSENESLCILLIFTFWWILVPSFCSQYYELSQQYALAWSLFSFIVLAFIRISQSGS